MAKTPQQLLAEYQRKIATLQAQLDSKNRKLLKLPHKFGFDSMKVFIAALQNAADNAQEEVEPRRRAKITPKMKAKVKALVSQEKTGAEIAKTLEISLPSVHNIKKELGLVKKRR